MLKKLPDAVDARIRYENRLPAFLVDKAFAFIRNLIEDMSDEEFFALRKFWKLAFNFFDAHFVDAPEASSAHEFITAMLSATNHRAYAIAPTPDSPHPTVDDLIAENRALKARIAELEKRTLKVSIAPPAEMVQLQLPL